MKYLTCLLFAILSSSTVTAGSQYAGNPNQPYPPACVTLPGPFSPLTNFGELGQFLDTRVDLRKSKSGTKVAVELRGYRLTCPTPNRSLIWLQFIVPQSPEDGADQAVELPQVVMKLPSGERIAMNLAEQPHLWGANSEIDRSRKYLGPRDSDTQVHDFMKGSYFFLDSYSPLSEFASNVTAFQYNINFTLILRYPPYDLASYPVSSLSQTFPYGIEIGDLPISGRLSGLWVVDGAEDQGFTIAVSSLPEDVNSPPFPDSTSGPFNPKEHIESLLIFLAHFTFDAEGKMLWLTGAVRFAHDEVSPQSVGSATISMLKVNHGKFLGDKMTDREDVGTIRIIRVADCNSIWIEYDYTKIGLGKAKVRLQRKFSLETAGYECRDFEARVEAVNS